MQVIFKFYTIQLRRLTVYQYFKMGTLVISEDLDEMPYYAAFQGMNSLLRQDQSSEKDIQYFWNHYNL